MTKPIRIVSISEFLAVSVSLELLRRDLSTRSCWEQDLESLLKYWGARTTRLNKLLIVSCNATPGGNTLNKKYFLRMHAVAGSLGWMAVRSKSLVKLMGHDGILLCQAIYKMEKQ